MKQQLGWVVAAAVLVGMAGCKSSSKSAGAPSGASPVAEQPAQVTALDPATLGDVTGKVHFTGKIPAPVKIDMSMDPACDMSAGGGDNFSEQLVGRSGGLGNVFLYVKSGPAVAMHYVPVPIMNVVMDQKGCRYTPHVIGVERGGTVEFRNSDVTMHNIHTMPTSAGSEPIDISQGPKGTPQTKQFNQVEMMIPVRCNNHPWMNAFINVAPTPFFAVTDPDGSFEIKGLPAGDYTLGAVHEKLGEQTIHITVKPHATATAEFTYAAK